MQELNILELMAPTSVIGEGKIISWRSPRGAHYATKFRCPPLTRYYIDSYSANFLASATKQFLRK